VAAWRHGGVAAWRHGGVAAWRRGGAFERTELESRSYCTDWSIAQILSHLGSQAEIFALFVDAGLTGAEPPGQSSFPPIWDAWNAKGPEEQARDSVAANERFVTRLEQLDEATMRSFRLKMFGMDLSMSDMLRMRLSEHALHSWDIAIASIQRQQWPLTPWPYSSTVSATWRGGWGNPRSGQ
jgi:uncharacterized protein (TIGR03083 family)